MSSPTTLRTSPRLRRSAALKAKDEVEDTPEKTSKRPSKQSPLETIDTTKATPQTTRKWRSAVTPQKTSKRSRKKSPLKTPDETLSTPQTKSKRRRVVTPISDPPNRIPDSEFLDLEVEPDEFRPSTTLTTGQCFCWKSLQSAAAQGDQSAWGTHNATEWIGTLRVSQTGESLVVVIRETPSTTLYRVLYGPPELDVRAFLYEYFQLDDSLVNLYQKWSDADERLARIAQCIRGVRIISQDPWECLASFITSSNNNIPRITKILSSIRREYGNLLIPEGEHGLEEAIYSFPSLEELRQKATDQDLREKCGIGYRAKYILETMDLLEKLGGEPYLHKLKEQSKKGELTPAQVQEEMIRFSGVGRKVADCVALFSLHQAEAIPVDVHVWNIACRDYDPDLKSVKSLTPTVYRQVEELFRSRFRTKSGWAHSLLFVAELPSFRSVLPSDILDEMDKFREEEKARKQKAKKGKSSE